MPILKVAVLYGGKSTEHEVSVHSAQTVCRVLSEKKDKYEVYPIFISKQGRWFLQKACGPQHPTDKPITPVLKDEANLVALDGSFPLRRMWCSLFCTAPTARTALCRAFWKH